MSNEKFTKGPWIVFGDWGITDNSGRLIAQFEPLKDETSNGNSSESFANADLIAVAPKMYDLLKRLTSHDNCKKDIVHLLCEADSLLAEARGEK